MEPANTAGMPRTQEETALLREKPPSSAMVLENSGENDPDFFGQSERQGFRHNGKQAQNGHHNRGRDSPSHEKGPKSRNMK